VPDAAEAAAALGLALGDDGERGFFAGGELAGGLVVGAVDFGEELQGKIAGAVAAVGLHEGGAEAGGAGGETVAAGADGLEGESLFAEFFHVLPDGDAADAEFTREGAAGDELGFGGDQFAEDDGLGRGGSRGVFFHVRQSSPMSTQTL